MYYREDGSAVEVINALALNPSGTKLAVYAYDAVSSDVFSGNE